jgi:heavy metal sensor kinase
VRLQLTAWYGAALIVLLLVLGLFVYWLLSTNLRHDAEAQLSTRASQIASTLNSDGESINFQDTQVPGELTLIYSTKGLLLEGAGGGQGAQSYRPSSLPSWANPGAHRSVFNTLGLTGGRWLIYAMPFPSGEQSTDSVGVGWLLVGRSLEPIYGMLNQTLYALALAGPLVILLACVGGYFMAGRALAPVAAITRTARRIQAEGLGRGNVSSIGMEGRHDELGELASTLDAMFARLEETFVRERRFTSDAAHELRTPLAVVQAETSLALARPRPVDEYKRALNVVEGESARMGKLVADLLTLARADEGQYQLSHEPVDFSSLCRGVVCQLSKLASDKRVSLTAEVQEGVSVVGDSMWLTQMLHNLVDNAIKYTEVGGWVKLRLARSAAADAVEVSVEDNGIGISAEQLPHIFDRFYRADKSRGRDNESPGLGLGLAICEWIAKAHDGRIDVRSTLGQGSCFQVSLPGMRGKG